MPSRPARGVLSQLGTTHGCISGPQFAQEGQRFRGVPEDHWLAEDLVPDSHGGHASRGMRDRETLLNGRVEPVCPEVRIVGAQRRDEVDPVESSGAGHLLPMVDEPGRIR